MLFELVRHDDKSGVSGTGVVVEGVQLSSGTCMVEWVCGKWLTQGVYPDIQAVIDVHGHDGATEVRYVRAFTRESKATRRSAEQDGNAEQPRDTGRRSWPGMAGVVRDLPRSRVH